MDFDKAYIPKYDNADRDHMRRLLQKGSVLIDLIANNQVPLGSYESAELIDLLAAKIGNENEKQKEDDALEELKNDRYSLINLYGAVKIEPAFIPLYRQIGSLLRKYGLFDEEVVLLEHAVSDGVFSEENLIEINNTICNARRLRDSDDAVMSEIERTTENLRRALQKKPLDKAEIDTLLEQCTHDDVLYDIACDADRDLDMKPIREKAARLIRNRDYRYALSSHIYCEARTSMILDLYEPLEGDELFIARTILTDPKDVNKMHMLLYCKDEALLMLGWKYVHGDRKFSEDRLHDMGSRFPEAYLEMDPQERIQCEQEWLGHASQLALDLLSEDEAVRERLAGRADVDSDPLHFFLSIHHPSPAKRWWHARKLKNPVRIAYVGSWTSDDQIKESLSVRMNSTRLITEMIYGDDSGMDALDLVFAFKKPEDLTLQDRFCMEIMKNHPDRNIREHVRTELLRGNVEIPGVDLTKTDPFFDNDREKQRKAEMTEQDHKTVYVCYSQRDREYGSLVVKSLSSMDFEVHDRCDEKANGDDYFSERYQEQAKKAIRDAAEHGCFLFLMTKYSKQDLMMKRELEHAMMYDTPVAIAFLGVSVWDLSSDLKYLVSRVPCTGLDGNDPSGIAQIASLVGEMLLKKE
ncbi:MAG: toll/interleukin-1 receptor domain-containing protein [Erysipelotrichaceae bacterium]|nr:toll/interleukin-1 receptor domain-containing protein [Erysipelotrichaceae bacterium]